MVQYNSRYAIVCLFNTISVSHVFSNNRCEPNASLSITRSQIRQCLVRISAALSDKQLTDCTAALTFIYTYK